MEEKHHVPWFCSAEWREVFKNIYGTKHNDATRLEALEVLKIWKSRTPFLQSGVEGTLIVLEALLLNNKKLDDHSVRLLQSTSVLRFLNICAVSTNRQNTFYQTAKKRKIPEWIISLRHDAAHSQNIPSKDILNRALLFCIDWLHKKYWRPISKLITDYVNDSDSNFRVAEVEVEDLTSKLEPLLSNYGYINVSRHPFWNYLRIKDITDESIKTVLLEDLNSLLEPNLINDYTSAHAILRLLWLKMDIILQEEDNVEKKSDVFIQLLLKEETFLYSIDNFIDIFEVMEPKQIPKKLLFLWEELLKNMHNKDMMPVFIEKLLHFVGNHQETHQRRLLAALWLAELGKAFEKCLLAQSLYNEVDNKKYGNTLSDAELNLKLKQKCEQVNLDMKNVLTLNLTYNIPQILEDSVVFKTTVLHYPNEFSVIYLPHLMSTVFKSNETKQDIMELTELYLCDKEKVCSEGIHTVEDIVKLDVGTNSELEEKMEVCINEETEKLSEKINQQNFIESRWKKVEDIDWSNCPIGILPWQKTSMNPLLDLCKTSRTAI